MRADFRIDSGTLYAILPDVEVNQPDWLVAIWSEPDYAMGIGGGLGTAETGWAESGKKVRDPSRYAALLSEIQKNYGEEIEVM